ncbi:MAG: hypothetical protein CSYNP_03992 [Syntrophus sp. SKADARSKE-3]|nr:hypothetical protein [Syntrophus sp. SKADARSKE-3]
MEMIFILAIIAFIGKYLYSRNHPKQEMLTQSNASMEEDDDMIEDTDWTDDPGYCHCPGNNYHTYEW